MRQKRLELRKPPVQRRARATLDSVLSAAAQVFEARGYAQGTTNRIAARAGVSIGTLYQYFPNKEAIAVALLERHIAETECSLQGWVNHMIAEQHELRPALHDYVTRMLDAHSGRPRLQHILLEETPLPERVHQALLEGERRAARTVAGLLKEYSEVSSTRLERIGYVVVQTVESLTHRYSAHPDEQYVSRSALVEELVTMLDAYLRGELHGS
jgi:AcrR family transcriptional regulator